MKFLTGLTAEGAIFISRALFLLSRPPVVLGAEDVTEALLPVLRHPDREEWSIAVPDSPFPIPLHPERDPMPLILAFQNSINATEKIFFEYIAGQPVVIDLQQLIPSAIRDQLKTQEELKDWFSTPHLKD